MTDIKRYSPTINDKPYKTYAYCEARLDGAFVSFADYASIVALKDARIKSLEDMGVLNVLPGGVVSELIKNNNALQEQVRSLVAENADFKAAASDILIMKDDDFFGSTNEAQRAMGCLVNIKTPATESYLREIRAQAVEDYGNATIAIGKGEECEPIVYAGKQALLYAARIRAGEVL